MRAKLKFYFLIFLYFFLMVMDALSTYIGTPDLALEGNPLVTRFGLGWGALFTANVLIYAFYIAAVYYAYVKYVPPLIQETIPARYISRLFYGRPDKFSWVFYRFPKNRAPFWACGGCTLGWALPLARILTVAEWMMHLLDIEAHTYNKIRAAVPCGRLDVLTALILALVIPVLWIAAQYRKNKKALLFQEAAEAGVMQGR